MKKRIMIPIAILLIFITLIAVIVITDKPSDNKQVADKSEDTVKDANNKGITDNKSGNTEFELNLSSILTFDKSGGVLKLYDSEGNLLDELDLKMLDIGEVQNEDINENHQKEIEQKSDKNNDVKAEEKQVIVKALVGEETVDVEISGDKLILYDENKEKIKEVDLKVLLGKEEAVKEEKYLEEEKTETNVDIYAKNYNLANNKLLNTPANTTFTNFRTIKDELVFRDDKRNALILIDVENNKIVANLVLKGVELSGLSSVFLTEENIYLTFNADKRITKIPRSKGISGNISRDDITKYEIGAVPNYVYAENKVIYYAAENIIGKYDLTKDEENRIIQIDVGDKTLDIYVEKDYIYAINEFGKGNETSVLIKINKENLTVEEIMELKGIYSKFIGIDGNIAYIRQKDSVKSVDLKNMKPLSAFPRKEGVPILVNNNIVYVLEDNVLKIAEIGKQIKNIDSFKIEGFNFVLK